MMLLLYANEVSVKTAKPIGFMESKNGQGDYLLMEKIPGISGRGFIKYLQSLGYDKDKIRNILQVVVSQLEIAVDEFREKVGIDKRWRVKDTIIEFNETTEQVEKVTPIDLERAKIYDEYNPEKIDTIEQIAGYDKL